VCVYMCVLVCSCIHMCVVEWVMSFFVSVCVLMYISLGPCRSLSLCRYGQVSPTVSLALSFVRLLSLSLVCSLSLALRVC